MAETLEIEPFSLLGGPLHRLGSRLGLVRGGTNTAPLGLALGLFLWTVTMLLVFVQGRGHQVYSLSLIGGHVRLLIVIPLFFVCESWVDPRMTTFVGTLVRSGIVPPTGLPALRTVIARFARLRDSWWPEATFMLLSLLLPWIAPWLHLSGTTSAYDPTRNQGSVAATDLWYSIVCLTLCRFLVFRWLWRLALWTGLLWCLSRMKLYLVPTHPDGAGGLGYLEVVHMHFVPLIVAISCIQSASLAEEIASGTMTFEGIIPSLGMVLLVDAVLFLGPMLLFADKLWGCRVKGLSDYMVFAEKYVRGFDNKWVTANAVPGEPLLGTSDIQSLADLNNSVNIISNMRIVPVSWRLLIDMAMAATLPLLSLLLFKYPAAELIQKLFSKVVGL